MLPPSRFRNPSPLLPMATKSTSMPLPRHSLKRWVTTRSTFVLRPPQSPLSVVTTMTPTRFTGSRRTRNGCLYSVLAFEMCIAMLNTRSTYGLVARMRSCAFFILEAATISMAFVILRVLCTLLIFVLISFDPAMTFPCSSSAAPSTARSVRACFLEILDRRRKRLLVVRAHFLRRLDLVGDRPVLAPHELPQPRF